MTSEKLPENSEDLILWSLANAGLFSPEDCWGEHVVRDLDYADSTQARLNIISWAKRMQSKYPKTFTEEKSVVGLSGRLRLVIIAGVPAFNLSPNHTLIDSIQKFHARNNYETSSRC